MATDIIQRIREAIVAVLDTNAAIVALTTRANGNIFPFADANDIAAPLLSYFVVTANPAGGIGDTRRAVVQFTAVALDMAVVNALLEAVENNFTTPALIALNPTLDAYVEFTARRDTPGRADDGTSSAELDALVVVTK